MTYYIFCDICAAHARVNEKPEIDPETSQLKYPIPPEWHYEHTVHVCPECARWLPPQHPLIDAPVLPEVEPEFVLDADAASQLEPDGEGMLVIPEGIRAIGYKAFMTRRDFTRVKLPSTLESIDAFAFARTALVELAAPDSLRAIGDKAFSQCHQLVEADLGTSLEAIGEEAFANCKIRTLRLPASLTHLESSAFANMKLSFGGDNPAISIDPNNPVYSLDENGGLYVKTPKGNVLAALLDSSITEFEVAPGTVSIHEGACRRNRTLERVHLPEGLVYIGPGAFKGCNSLVQVNIPDSVRAIDSNAFSGTVLESIDIPAGLKYLGPGALDISSETQSRVLKRISVHPDNERFSVQNKMLCMNIHDGGCAVLIAPSSGNMINLPENALTIAPAAFCAVGVDKVIRVFSTLESIHPYAFPFNQYASFEFVNEHDGDDPASVRLYHPSRYALVACCLPKSMNVHRLAILCDNRALSLHSTHDQAAYVIKRFGSPQFLNNVIKAAFTERIRQTAKKAIVEFAKRGELENITLMAEYGFLTADNITEVIDRVTSLGYPAATACLLDIKQNMFDMPRVDYSL